VEDGTGRGEPPPSLISDPRSRVEMTREERAELDRLYAEFIEALSADGGEWPVYTGPGE
jgi:hypothetical protein